MTTTLFNLSPSTVGALRWVAAIIVFDFLVVIIATVCDLVSALRKSARAGLPPASRGFRRTVDKLLRYFLTLIALASVDSLLLLLIISLREDMGWTLPAVPFLTSVGAIALSAIEIKSVIENSHRRDTLQNVVNETAHTLSQLIDDPAVAHLAEIIRKYRS